MKNDQVADLFKQTVLDISYKMFNFENLCFKPEYNLNPKPDEKLVICYLNDENDTDGLFMMSINCHSSKKLLEPFVDYDNKNPEHNSLLNSILEEYVNSLVGQFSAKIISPWTSRSYDFSVPKVIPYSKELSLVDSLGILKINKECDIKFFMTINSLVLVEA